MPLYFPTLAAEAGVDVVAHVARDVRALLSRVGETLEAAGAAEEARGELVAHLRTRGVPSALCGSQEQGPLSHHLLRTAAEEVPERVAGPSDASLTELQQLVASGHVGASEWLWFRVSRRGRQERCHRRVS